MPRNDTTIVVPCFNEEARLQPSAFRHAAAEMPWIRFLFVDDGSQDGTLEQICQMVVSDPWRFDLHQLETNCGKGEAVRQGLIKAVHDGSRFVGFWDADLATPLRLIPQFRNQLLEQPRIEAVLGVRIRLAGRQLQRDPIRGFLGRWFARAVSGVLRFPLIDTQCGAKLFRITPHFLRIVDRPYQTRWLFDVEQLLRYHHWSGCRLDRILYELPLDEWREVAGSRLTTGDFLWAACQLAKMGWSYSRNPAPAPLMRMPDVHPAPGRHTLPTAATSDHLLEVTVP